VNSVIEKIKAEFDLQKQQALAQDLARYMAQQQYNIPFPTSTLGFGTYWPCIGNLGVLHTYVGGSSTVETYAANVWIDQTKPPFKSS
jgi:ABC-type transport system substrate-binding protein